MLYNSQQYRLLMFTNTGSVSKTKYNLTYRMGQKLSSKLLFISSPNTDGFLRFYISQGSVATQLKCGVMFSNHFIANFPRNAPVKKFWKSVSIWQRYEQKVVALFGPPCTSCSSLQHTEESVIERAEQGLT